MIESQEKKLSLLDEADRLDDELIALISSGKAEQEQLEANLAAKGSVIEQLDELDDGFEALYAKVRDELAGNKEQYKNEIRTLQDLISRITDKTVKIQAKEARSKTAIEDYFLQRKKKLKEGKSSVKIANAYAVNMRKINQVDSFFVDRKK